LAARACTPWGLLEGIQDHTPLPLLERVVERAGERRTGQGGGTRLGRALRRGGGGLEAVEHATRGGRDVDVVALAPERLTEDEGQILVVLRDDDALAHAPMPGQNRRRTPS